MKRVSLNRYQAEISEAPWTFSRIPAKYWKDKHNQAKFFNWLGNKLSLKNLDEWYSVRPTDVIQNGGSGLLEHYKGSLAVALKNVYQDHPWIPWKFHQVPHGFWKHKKNRLDCVEWIQKELNIQSLEDWYRVRQKDLESLRGGSGLIHAYGTLCDMLMDAYPHYNWEPWRFTSINIKHFQNQPQLYRYVDYLSKELHIQQLDDWYRVSAHQLLKYRAHTVVQFYGGLMPFLSMLYPDHNWNYLKFNNKSKRSSQRWLMMKVAEMFPNEEILEEYPLLNSSLLTLDVYLPNLHLGFEYQGRQHFHDLPFFKPLRKQEQIDAQKREVCLSKKIQLVEVPYWWDNTVESLREIIEASTSFESQHATQ